MKYLLIDFGASFVKCIVYDSDSNTFMHSKTVESPFLKCDKINRKNLNDFLVNIVNEYLYVKSILVCTILGGTWIKDTYYSWKTNKGKQIGEHCLISGFLNCTVHSDHASFTNAKQYSDKLELSGYILDLPIYSPLGDTNCAMRSINLGDEEVAINMGTGSQIITKKETIRYFPSGRSLLVFENFFNEIRFNMFNEMSNLDLEDVIKSTLCVELSNFTQSRNFSSGGFIGGILEGNFTIKNLLGSIIKSLVTQYKSSLINPKKIYLLGGIPKKLKVIKPAFQYYYENVEIVSNEDNIEDTHLGMSKLVYQIK